MTTGAYQNILRALQPEGPSYSSYGVSVRKTLYRSFFVLFVVTIGLWFWMGGVVNPRLQKWGHMVPSSSSSRPSTSTGKLSDILWPVLPADKKAPWVHANHVMLKSFLHCIERSDCHMNQTKVVLLESMHFRFELEGMNSGEQIWARSTTQALRNMGYTFLYTSNLPQTLQFYQMFPNYVKIIVTDNADDCFRDGYCSLSADNPAGIPPWKMFTFSYWAPPANPLGDHWTLAPENYDQLGIGHNTYLGYSIESACRMQPFIPHLERENQAYILAKYMFFFTAEQERAWTPAIYDAATEVTGVQYVLGAFNHSDTWQGTPELPSNHINFGKINQSMFLDKLSRTRVLIGLGNPATSPTPYDALCLGVPFINPIGRWDANNPSDKSAWISQHAALQSLDPPYVYNVRSGDLDGFVEAVKGALSHPIESYVPEDMRMSSVERRLGAILEKDWEHEATFQAHDSH